MIGLLLIILASYVLFRLLGGTPRLRLRRANPAQATSAKIEELTEYASRLRTIKKYNKAEKVYLQILRIDHRHTPTYSRLGTLYTAQRNFNDAIECFQMATQLTPSGQTYYNLGLSFYENNNAMKAIAAFEKAIMFEPSTSRYVGLAKSFEQMGDHGGLITSLERALEIEFNPKVAALLIGAYQENGRMEDATALQERVQQQTAKQKPKRKPAVTKARPKRLEKTKA